MTTAIIGVGNIGGTVARNLVAGNEAVVLAAQDEAHARALADELGPLAGAASVDDAIRATDTVLLALWLNEITKLVPGQAAGLEDTVVIDPSNPLGFDESGQMLRTLPDDQSAGSIVAALLPTSAHYVKAFGTLDAGTLRGATNREPRRAVLFYASADGVGAATIERLIRAAGFEPVNAGDAAAALRMEMPGGDLHLASLGRLLDVDEARAAVAAREVSA